jgi:hypothetical protein
MSKQEGSTGPKVTVVVLGLTLLVVGGIVLWQNVFSSRATEPTDQSTVQEEAPAEDTPAQDDTPAVEETPADPVIDPSTVNTIDITPLSIVVTYGKTLPGFGFEVKRAASGTQYAEFTSERLIGTKCTDDSGLFATIIKNPSETESSTIVKTKKLDSDTFGLSLAGDNCTSDTELLKQFQGSFSDNFSALRKL